MFVFEQDDNSYLERVLRENKVKRFSQFKKFFFLSA